MTNLEQTTYQGGGWRAVKEVALVIGALSAVYLGARYIVGEVKEIKVEQAINELAVNDMKEVDRISAEIDNPSVNYSPLEIQALREKRKDILGRVNKIRTERWKLPE